MSKPFFSIIIPTLNEAKYLPHLLDDLSGQSYRDFEVILADGHSDDTTVAKAKTFKKSLPTLKIINSPKRHVSIQRNLGAKTSLGQWLVFMDADNRLPFYYLDGLHYQILKQQPDTFTTWLDPEDDKPGSLTIARAANLIIEASKVIEFEGALGALIGCKKNIFEKIGGFDTNMNFGEDGEFIRRGARKNYKFHIFKDPRFTFSLRRFRREGTLATIQQSAKLFIKILTDEEIDQSKEYPMGGNAKVVSKSKVFLKNINQSFKKITSQSKLIKRLKISLEQLLED